MSVIKLLKNINLDIEYENTIDFDSLSSQYNYFNNQVASGDTYNDVLFIRNTAERVFGIFGNANTKMNFDVKLNIEIDEARKYNYCMFQNDNDTKWYYGFIISTTFVNKDVTDFGIALDVFQSFLFDFTLESAYIDREHQDRWARTLGVTTPIYNYNIEKLKMGMEYQVKNIQRFPQKQLATNVYLVWCLFLWKINPAQSYALYKAHYGPNTSMYVTYAPYVIGDDEVNCTYTKEDNTHFNVLTANELLERVNDSVDLEAVYVVPYIPLFTNLDFTIVYDGTNHTLEFISDDDTRNAKYLPCVELRYQDLTDKYKKIVDVSSLYTLMFMSFNNQIEETIGSITMPSTLSVTPSVNASGEVQQSSSEAYENKLDTYPFSLKQLQVNNNIKDLRNEFLYGNATLKIKAMYFDSPVLQVSAQNYNGDSSFNREGIIDRTINELILISDPYKEYWRSNKSRAMTGLASSAGNALLSVLPTNQTSSSIIAGQNVNYSHDSTRQTNTMASNKDKAGAIMNFGTAVANVMAMSEDLQATPNSFKNLGNNGTMALMSLSMIPTIYSLQIKDFYKDKAFNYFRLFGYNSLRFTYYGDGKGLNLRSRYYYNYIKCIDVKLHSTFNKLYVNQLEEIFRKGITIWHKRDTISNFKMFKYDKENWEVSLL